MFCKWCGKEIDSDMRFCLFCGKPIKKVNAPETNLAQSASTDLKTKVQTPTVYSANKDYKKQRRRNTTVLAIVFGIIDLLLIAVIVLSSFGIIDISINSLFNKESSEVIANKTDEETIGTRTPKPSETEDNKVEVQPDYQISFILPSLNPADYNSTLLGYELLITGAEETAKAINAKITVYRYNHTDGETTADEEAGAFEKAINMEADAIIFVPFGPFAGKSFYNTIIEPCLQIADDACIPVILVDYLPASGTYPIVATDHYESGVLAGEIAASLGKPGEKAAVISGPEAILPLTLHIKGFMDGLSDFAPGMELIDPIFIDFVAETGDLAEVATNELIETYPDLSVIFATNCNLGGPAQNVIDYTGHSDEVSLIVFNATNYSIDGLETGVVDCIIQPDYYSMGYESISMAFKLIEGGQVEDVYIEPFVVTHDNYEEYEDELEPYR